MIFTFYTISCLFAAFLFCIWKTSTVPNILTKMYMLLLTVYFGYNTLTHEVFQNILK